MLSHLESRAVFSNYRADPMCVLNSLAQAEMRLTLAAVLRRFDFELFETTAEDIKIARDYFVGVPEPGSKGVRAVVTKVL